MGTDIPFSAVGSNRFRDELGCDRAVDKDFFGFFFCHWKNKNTQTSNADAHANKWLHHRLLKLNFIQWVVVIESPIHP